MRGLCQYKHRSKGQAKHQLFIVPAITFGFVEDIVHVGRFCLSYGAKEYTKRIQVSQREILHMFTR